MPFFEHPAFTDRYEPYRWRNMHDSFSLSLEVNYESIDIPERPLGTVVPILNVREIYPNEVCLWFKKMMRWFGIAPFIAPSFTMDQDEVEWVRHEFADITGPDVRQSCSGSYVVWATDHVTRSPSGLRRIANFDSRLTVTEALLYHIYQTNRFGPEYLWQLHYADSQTCKGSAGRNQLRWDLQDIKVCLD